MIQSSRGYTVVTDTVSYKSGGKRGPEMIVRIQGEVTLRSCPYSQSKGSNSEGNYQLVEFVACSPSQVQNPTFLSTIHHRSSLPFLIRSSRFIQIQMENWAMAGSVRRRMECGIQFSCLQTVSDWEENMAEFPVSIQWSQVHGGRKECCMLQVLARELLSRRL